MSRVELGTLRKWLVGTVSSRDRPGAALRLLTKLAESFQPESTRQPRRPQRSERRQ